MSIQNTQSALDNARAYLLHKAGSIRRPYGRYLTRQESRLQAKVSRRFNTQKRWVIAEMASLSFFQETKGLQVVERKAADAEVERFLAGLPVVEELADDIIITAKPTYKKGAEKGIDELNMSAYGVSFSLVNPRAVQYLRNIKDLELSERRGSITRTTKDKIQRILVDAAETGKSYNEVAKLIQAQGDEGVFSRARGELIAVNQIGHAFGTGNQDMVDEFVKKTGAAVQKQWRTVNDDRVTPECRANQDQEWISNDAFFSSGDRQAPRRSNPRCRCATIYRTVETE